jgi:hypothetical protein
LGIERRLVRADLLPLAGWWPGVPLAVRPTPTRFVLRMLAAVTISDFLHLAYSRLNESRKTVTAGLIETQNEKTRPGRAAMVSDATCRDCWITAGCESPRSFQATLARAHRGRCL